MSKQTVMLDTSVLIHEPTSLLDFCKEADVLIPIYVIMELDVLKDKKNHVSHLARKSSHLILTEMDNGDHVKVVTHTEELDIKSLDSASEIRYVDLLILKTAMRYHEELEDFTLITRDTNLRILCESMGIRSEGYVKDGSSESTLEGKIETITPSPLLMAKLQKSYWEGAVRLTEQECFDYPLHDNQYVTFVDNKQKTHIFQYKEHSFFPIEKKNVRTEKVKPRNVEQTVALDLLLDEDIKLVALLGKAGTGKTFLTLAAALHQKAIYQRILLSKPVVDVGKGIGFLPGAVGEKLEPWMQSFFDNLDQINPYWDMEQGEERNFYFEKNHIEIQPINSIRGRSLKNAFMIIDEAQNLTKHEIKSIVTRAAEGTKVVLLGDPYQIDNPYLDTRSNGLTYVVEKMKGQPIFGYTSLHKSERSELSDIAADLL